VDNYNSLSTESERRNKSILFKKDVASQSLRLRRQTEPFKVRRLASTRVRNLATRGTETRCRRPRWTWKIVAMRISENIEPWDQITAKSYNSALIGMF
jgi:hypothetical protein